MNDYNLNLFYIVNWSDGAKIESYLLETSSFMFAKLNSITIKINGVYQQHFGEVQKRRDRWDWDGGTHHSTCEDQDFIWRKWT